MNFRYNINFDELRQSWGKTFRKFSNPGSTDISEDGYQLLERILNSRDLNLNQDFFLYREGKRIAELHSTKPLYKRLASIDGQTKRRIKKEILENGASLKIDQVSRYSSEINSLAKNLSRFFGLSVTCNLYYTPAYSRCFDAHFDGYDIVILQLSGVKDWKISNPSKGKIKTGSLKSNRPEKVSLSAGDVLFLPEGALHEASTNQEPSIHLTFGLHPISLATYLRESMDYKIEGPFFEQLRKTVLASASFPNQNGALNKENAQILTKHFRNFLDQLIQFGFDQDFSKQALDLENDSRLLLDLNIHPSTKLYVTDSSNKIKNTLIKKNVLNFLKKYRKRTFFYAGELLLSDSTKKSWKKSYLLIRELFKDGFILPYNPDSTRIEEPFGDDFFKIQGFGLFPFFDSNGKIWVASIQEKEGFFSIPNKFIRDFVKKLETDPKQFMKKINSYAKS